MNRVHPISLRLSRPFNTSRGPVFIRDVVLFEVSEGALRGYGEAAPLEDFGTESRAEAIAALELNALPTTPSASYAWECGHADLEARRAGVPLYEFFARNFGTTPNPSIVLNATIGAGSAAATSAAVEAAWSEGFRTFKLKVGVDAADEELERVNAVRGRFPDALLRLDANQAWSFAEAESFLTRLGPECIEYVEEPTAGGLRDFVALRELGIPLAADESCADPEIITALIAARAVDILVLKPMVLGRINRTAELVKTARAAGIDVVLSSAIDSAVGRTATAHLAAALGITRACGLATGSFFEADIGPVVSSPSWELGRTPGLGFTPALESALLVGAKPEGSAF